MLLTKSRIPMVAAGIILLLGFVLFLVTERASADVAADPFTNTATDISWDWHFDAATGDVNVCVVFGSSWTGAASAAHDIEVFLDPVAGMDPLGGVGFGAATFEGPVLAAATGLADNTFAVNTVYCLSGALVNVGAANLIGLAQSPTAVGIHILDVAHAPISTSNAPAAADIGWDWTYDSRGLQVVTVLGNSWNGVAANIEVWVNGALQQTIAAPAVNTISPALIAGVNAAPTSVALHILDGAGNHVGQSAAPADADLDADGVADDLIPDDLGWEFEAEATTLRVKVVLGASAVHTIEVYPNPQAGDSPALSTSRPTGEALPTAQVITLDVTGLTAPTTSVRVQFLDVNGNLITLNSGTGVHKPVADLIPPPPPPAPAPVPTPVPTVEVPIAQVTTVDAPAGGAAVVIQPSAAATVSAPDGSVVVSVPVTANAETFQIAYDPSPADVPVAPAGTTIIRAFDLNAHDANGTKVSITLLKTITITVKYTDADLAATAQQSPTNLKVASYNAATQTWTPLNTTLDLAARTLTAKATHLSLFGMASVEPAPQVVAPTPTAIAPSTGDWAPGSGLILALVLAGFLLVIAGGTYLTQARRARS